MKRHAYIFASLMLVLGLPDLALAGGHEPELNGSDTAWLLTATALVLFMTIPGLALFYGGLVRTKNVLSVLMQCFALTAVLSVVWVIIGYSLAFNSNGMEAGSTNINSFVGGLGTAFLSGVTADSLSGTIPETVFITFQMTFFIITPALIVGAFAERMKFSAVLLFSVLWGILVYAPICHMTWGGDGSFFGDMGVLDFAGGLVVHINAGIAALVACIVIGKRQGYPDAQILPHSLSLTVVGASMLWVGWFGFNAGSAVAADGAAGMAMLVTQISAAVATSTWMFIEWIKNGKPSILGAVTGTIAGLGAITPASGSVGPPGRNCHRPCCRCDLLLGIHHTQTQIGLRRLPRRLWRSRRGRHYWHPAMRYFCRQKFGRSGIGRRHDHGQSIHRATDRGHYHHRLLRRGILHPAQNR